jgi:DNA repair protein RecN (Recombination protein N)
VGGLTTEHERLAHAQALIGGAQQALQDVSDGEVNALQWVPRAASALREVSAFDAQLAPVLEVLAGAEAQLQDAAHSLAGLPGRTDLDPIAWPSSTIACPRG